MVLDDKGKDSGPTPGVSPRSVRRSEIECEAGDILKRHGLWVIPVDPVILANREGIRVHNAKFASDDIAGMLARRGPSVVMLVDQADPPYRKRFSIAHELGHHFLHLTSDGSFVDSKVDLFRDLEPAEGHITAERLMEIEANQFAAALLMPATFVSDAFARKADLRCLAREFNVSEAAMGIRLAKLGLG